MKITYELNKKQIATLEGLKFITPTLNLIGNVDVYIKGRRITAKYQCDSFYEPYKCFQNLVGIAECDNEDEFNEAIGIKLAVSSLLKKTVDLAKDILYRKSDKYNKNVHDTLVSIHESQVKLKRILTKYSK